MRRPRVAQGVTMSLCLTHATCPCARRLAAVLVDGVVDEKERAMLSEYAAKNGVSDALHVRLLEQAGWSEDEYATGCKS